MRPCLVSAFAVLLVALFMCGCVQQGGQQPGGAGNASAPSTAANGTPPAQGGPSVTAQHVLPPENESAGKTPAAGPGPETTPAKLPVALTIPGGIEKNCVGFLVGDASEIQIIKNIGGAWTRPHPGPFAWGWIEASRGSYDFTEADSYVKAAQESNVSVLGTIWPFADWDQSCRPASDCAVTSRDTFYPFWPGSGIPASRCKPCDMDAYANFVKKLVERYDGDGIDDMPGLTLPVRYWEILNEPDLQSEDLTFFKGTEEDYVEVLNATYGAIRAACPDCKALQGGAAGTDSYMLAYWKKVFQLGGADYFDIANIHCINCFEKANLNVRLFKQAMDESGVSKPVWVTEAQFASGDSPSGPVDGALQAGAQKIFFTSFRIGAPTPPQGPDDYSPEYGAIPAKCSGVAG